MIEHWPNSRVLQCPPHSGHREHSPKGLRGRAAGAASATDRLLRHAMDPRRPFSPGTDLPALSDGDAAAERGEHGPNPEDWCRPLDRSPRFGALIDGKLSRSTGFGRHDLCDRSAPRNTPSAWGPFRRWARAHPGMPQARPERPVDLALLPPLF